MSAQWAVDSAEGGKVSVVGNTVTVEASKQGTPFNVRLDDATLAAKENQYFEVTVTEKGREASLGVGVVKLDEFLPGWKTKGMFYNGNVTNGSAGLIMSFGHKHVEQGDVVGVRVQRFSDKVEVTYYHNGACLGVAFSVPSAVVSSADALFPCLHVGGKVVVTYVVKSGNEAVPTSEVKRSEPSVDPEKAYMGEWKLTKALTGPELGEMPLPGDEFPIIMKIGHEAGTPETQHVMSVKVANAINTSFEITGFTEGAHTLKMAPHCMMTRMMPPPELHAFETYISTALPTLMRMTVSDELLLIAPAAEMAFKRHAATHAVLSKY